MERLVEQDPGIGQLRMGEQSFFRMPGNLASYRMRERAETDYRNAFKYATAKGMAEGMAQGRAEGMAQGMAQGRAEGMAQGRAEGKAEGRAEGKAEGKAEGRAEGKAEGRVETARNLLQMGFELDKIAQATQLSLDEIKGLMAKD